MTVNTPKGKRGKVKPPTARPSLKLSVENSLGAWLAHMEAQVVVFTAMQSKDPAAMLEGFRAVIAWFVKYGGVTEEEVLGIERNALFELMEQAQEAFGDVPIPQTKSAP